MKTFLEQRDLDISELSKCESQISITVFLLSAPPAQSQRPASPCQHNVKFITAPQAMLLPGLLSVKRSDRLNEMGRLLCFLLTLMA